VKANTEIYLNEDLFYSDGYKLIVTNEDNKMIPFTTVNVAKNYIGIQLDAMDDLTDGELIKINLTPTMVGGTYSGEHEEAGFKFSYTATENGSTELCTFGNPFPDKTIIPETMHGELVSADGSHTWRFHYNDGVIGDCFWMSGGTFRLLEYKYVIHEKILFEAPIPFINGANFDILVTPSASTTTSSFFDAPIGNLMSMLQ